MARFPQAPPLLLGFPALQQLLVAAGARASHGVDSAPLVLHSSLVSSRSRFQRSPGRLSSTSTPLRSSLKRWLWRALTAFAALALLLASARQGASFFSCEAMSALMDHPCCEQESPLARGSSHEAELQRDDSCCAAHRVQPGSLGTSVADVFPVLGALSSCVGELAPRFIPVITSVRACSTVPYPQLARPPPLLRRLSLLQRNQS